MKTSRRVRIVLYFLAFVVCLHPARAAAEDFAFHEVGARAAALGGAFTARADDIYALWYNPAGLAFLTDFRFKTNVAFGDRTTEGAEPDGGRAYRSERERVPGLRWPCPGNRPAASPLATGFFYPYTYEASGSRTSGLSRTAVRTGSGRAICGRPSPSRSSKDSP